VVDEGALLHFRLQQAEAGLATVNPELLKEYPFSEAEGRAAVEALSQVILEMHTNLLVRLAHGPAPCTHAASSLPWA
jgi:hypothetical protein